MATVVNLPPDQSFGSGRGGVALGKLLSSIVEGRRKKEEKEERATSFQNALDVAIAEPDVTKREGIFAREIAPIAKDTEELNQFVSIFAKTRKQARLQREQERVAGIESDKGRAIFDLLKPDAQPGPTQERAAADTLGTDILKVFKFESDKTQKEANIAFKQADLALKRKSGERAEKQLGVSQDRLGLAKKGEDVGVIISVSEDLGEV